MPEELLKSLFSLTLKEQEVYSYLHSKLKNNISLQESYEILAQKLRDEFLIDNLQIILTNNSSNKESLTLGNKSNIEHINDLINICINKDIKISYILFFKTDKYIKNKELIEKLLSLISDKLYINYLNDKILNNELLDNTTGQYNRKYLFHYLEKMLPLSARENQDVAFLMIGLDHFKAVIDEFDYNVGDLVLNNLSSLIKENIRDSDIITRVESDQFLIVLPHVNGQSNAMKVANKLTEKFSKLEILVNEITQQKLKKSICIGVSLYPNDSINSNEILKNADISLYEARNKGRGQVLKFKKEEVSSIDLF